MEGGGLPRLAAVDQSVSLTLVGFVNQASDRIWAHAIRSALWARRGEQDISQPIMMHMEAGAKVLLPLTVAPSRERWRSPASSSIPFRAAVANRSLS